MRGARTITTKFALLLRVPAPRGKAHRHHFTFTRWGYDDPEMEALIFSIRWLGRCRHNSALKGAGEVFFGSIHGVEFFYDGSNLLLVLAASF